MKNYLIKINKNIIKLLKIKKLLKTTKYSNKKIIKSYNLSKLFFKVEFNILVK